MNPLANRNADTINQIVRLPKPDSASAGLSTPDSAENVTAINAIEPIGSGYKMKPKIVVTKMANKCHACGVRSLGIGKNHIMAPTEIRRKPFLRLLFTFSPPNIL
jgi:hypothetical protein